MKLSPIRIHLGSGKKIRIGEERLRIALPIATVLMFYSDLVREGNPVLLGLDVISQFGLILDFYKDELRSTSPSWKMRITYQLGRDFTAVPSTVPTRNTAENPTNGHLFRPLWTLFYPGLHVYFTKRELTRIHVCVLGSGQRGPLMEIRNMFLKMHPN